MINIFTALFLLFCSVNATAAETVITDRYTRVDIAPRADQQEPLIGVVNIHFGNDIHTVGEAINEVLKGSGYRWVIYGDDALFNTLELPSIVRTLGPIQLENALKVLAGSAWEMKVDKLNRTIWFLTKSQE
jgi:conjugative transfer region protein (TIGR03748 family)